MLFKLLINNDIRSFGLSQYVAISVTEVSDMDVDFTKVILTLILYQQHSHIVINYLLVLIIVDHIDIGWTFSHHVKGCYYTDDYQVDISYAAYWIKNLLFIFEKEAF